MENINPTQLKEWIDVIWELSSKGIFVFVIIYYRDLVIHTGKTLIDILASWVKRK